MKARAWFLVVVAALAGCGRRGNTPIPEVKPEVKPVPVPVEVKEAELPRLSPIVPEKPFTFAVLGDNRGESSGQAAPAFVKIVQALRKDSPALVINTGDMINGYKDESEAHLRKLWKGYFDALADLEMPVFHCVGNHDIFDPLSARLWKELLGPTYFAFDYGCARFIILDTETERSQIGKEQLAWLAKQLAETQKRYVFIVIHKPLFPVDGHIGKSLDEFPEPRDRLHELFVKHRKLIRAVFQGHEHMYHCEERDGLTYHTVAGGGAPLYVPGELGGFYHYLLVNVTADDVAVKVCKLDPRLRPASGATVIAPGMLLEGWESSLFWHTWDQSLLKDLSSAHATEGKQGLKLSFDLAQYEHPNLLLVPQPQWNLSEVARLSLDVFMPPEASGLTVSPSIKRVKSQEAPVVTLKPGWNTVSMDLTGSWLPQEDRAAARELQWTLGSANKRFSGWIVVDNLRAEGKDAKGVAPQPKGRLIRSGLLESWEGKLLWGTFSDTVVPEPTAELTTEGKQGLKVSFNTKKFPRPILYAALNPSWDLRPVSELAVDVYAPKDLAAPVTVTLALRAKEKAYRAPAVSLAPGWNKLKVDLGGAWLPMESRQAAELVEWTLSTGDRKAEGWVVFDNFRAQ